MLDKKTQKKLKEAKSEEQNMIVDQDRSFTKFEREFAVQTTFERAIFYRLKIREMTKALELVEKQEELIRNK